MKSTTTRYRFFEVQSAVGADWVPIYDPMHKTLEEARAAIQAAPLFPKPITYRILQMTAVVLEEVQK